jgi:hypothetical protein
LVSGVLLVFNSFGLASALCTVPGPQPGLSDSCGAMGVGSRPSRSEREAWESRAPASCVALRDHIAKFPDGVFRRQAADLLTARRTTVHESWTPVIKPLSLFEPATGAPVKDLSAAQAHALEQAQASAERICRDFGAGTLYRYRSAKPVVENWSCEGQGSGKRCGFEGRAECALDERHEIETETCG